MTIWLLTIPFFLVLCYSIFSGFKYTRMISNIFMGLVYRPSDFTSAARGEKVTILDSSDREISALYLPCESSTKALVFCHESGSNENSWEKYAYFFPGMGFHVLSVDFTDKNEESEKNSLSQWPHEEEVDKLVTVLRWAKRAISPNVRVVLFGVSKGADLALAVSFRDESVEAVISDGLFSMKEIFRDYIRKWAPILVRPNFFGEHYPDWVVNIFTDLGYWHCQKRGKRKFIDTEAMLRKNHAPLCMIHGEADDYVPVSHQKFLETLCRQNLRRDPPLFERLVVPNAKHNEAVLTDPGRYESEVRNFIGKIIK